MTVLFSQGRSSISRCSPAAGSERVLPTPVAEVQRARILEQEPHPAGVVVSFWEEPGLLARRRFNRAPRGGARLGRSHGDR
jgi:hypothetical protein